MYIVKYKKQVNKYYFFYMAAHGREARVAYHAVELHYLKDVEIYDCYYVFLCFFLFSGSSLLVIFGQAAQRHAIILRKTFIRSNETLLCLYFWLWCMF